MPDHDIHLFVESNPFDSPNSMIKALKGVTSLRLFKRFPLSKQLWRGVLWSPSHYVGTADHDVSKEVIKKYIQEQERHSSTG
jgi:putative transposase